MAKSKANARLLKPYSTMLKGLKVYGKVMKYNDLEIGELGFAELAHPYSKTLYPDATHIFRPKSWKYTWLFYVRENVDFEFLTPSV